MQTQMKEARFHVHGNIKSHSILSPIKKKYKKTKDRKSKIIDLSSWPCDKIARIQSSFDDKDWHENYQSHSAQSPGQKDLICIEYCIAL